MASSPVAAYHARQRSRVGELEAEGRAELQELQGDAWGALVRQISNTKINAVVSGVERAAIDARRQLASDAAAVNAAVHHAHATRQLQFLAGEGAAARWKGSESAARAALEVDEQEVRRAVTSATAATASWTALREIGQVERTWRLRIVLGEGGAFRAIAAQRASAELDVIDNPRRNFHSQTTLRRFVVALEEKHRLRLAVRFCCLYAEWQEEWRRLTLRLVQRMGMQCHIGAARIELQEIRERSEIASFFRHVHTDILEQLAVRSRRRQRRQNKLEWLRQLRLAEIERLRWREDEREEYVRFWRRDEMEKILQIQDALVAEMAEYGNADSAAMDVQIQRFSHETQQLEDASFRELQRYREQLLGFNSFVTAIEGQQQLRLKNQRRVELCDPIATFTGDLLRDTDPTAPHNQRALQDPDVAVAQSLRELSRVAGNNSSGAAAGVLTQPTYVISAGATGRTLLGLSPRGEGKKKGDRTFRDVHREGSWSGGSADGNGGQLLQITACGASRRAAPVAFAEFEAAQRGGHRASTVRSCSSNSDTSGSPRPQLPLAENSTPPNFAGADTHDDAVLRLVANEEATLRSRMRVNQFVDERERDESFARQLEGLQAWLTQHVAD